MSQGAERERARAEEDKRKEQVFFAQLVVSQSSDDLSKTAIIFRQFVYVWFDYHCLEEISQVLAALEELKKREEECRAAHELVRSVFQLIDIFSSFCRHSLYSGSAKELNVWIEAAKEKAAAAQKRKEERDEQMRVKILDANR